MTLKEASIEQLKALAYDTLVQIESHQVNLRQINAEIAERTKNMSEEAIATEEVVVEEVAAEEVAE